MREDLSTHSKLFWELHRSCNLLDRCRWAQKADAPPKEGSAPRGQYRLLSLLLNNDGMALRDIVEQLDIRPSSAGELVDKLQSAGLVERKADESDRRVVHVWLTETGREQARQKGEEREAMMQQMFEALSESETQQLLASLEKLNASLKEKAGPDEPRRGGKHCHGGHGPHSGGPRGPKGPFPHGKHHGFE